MAVTTTSKFNPLRTAQITPSLKWYYDALEKCGKVGISALKGEVL